MDRTGQITRGIAEYVARTGYDDLSEEAVESTKKSILDTIGIMLPATTLTPVSDLVHDLYTELDGGGECTLVGYGEKASVLTAAMINGSLTHAVDFDDFSGIEKPLVHPTANCLPAALALGEYLNARSDEDAPQVTGRDLICAVTLGNDVGIRMCCAVKGSAMHDYDFFPQTVFGVFQATVAACKLLGLSADQTADALGLAVNRVSGITESLFSCEFRSIRDSFGNEEGIRCALLAARGFSGSRNALEVLYDVIYGGNVDPTPLTDQLGEEFYTVKLVGYKPWPSCQSTQPYAQAVIEAREKHNIAPQDIVGIRFTGCSNGADTFFPKEEKARPQTGITAKTSLPYVAAVAALRGTIALSDFEVGRLADPETLAMAERMEFQVDDEMPLTSALVEIDLADGRRIEHRVDVLRGNVLNPMGADELAAKFRANARMGKAPLSDAAIEELIDVVGHLDEQPSLEALTRCLA